MRQNRLILPKNVNIIIRLLIIPLRISLIGCQQPNSNPKPVEALPTWRRFTSANSPLPHPQINALAISHYNVVWVGTANGLARYQQSQWTIFTTANSALPSNVIQALTLQPDGTLWVGTNKGLARVYHS